MHRPFARRRALVAALVSAVFVWLVFPGSGVGESGQKIDAISSAGPPAFAHEKAPFARRGAFEKWKAARGVTRSSARTPAGTRVLSGVAAVGRPSLVLNAAGTVVYTRQFAGAACDADLGLSARWISSIPYSANDVVRRITGAETFVFRATNSGTSGTTEPVWPTTFGATVVDGTVTWQATDRFWTASRAYPTGQTVRTAGTFRDFGFNFQAIQGGTTGSTQPQWPTTPGATVADGTVIWKAIGFFPGTFNGCIPMQLVSRASGGAETAIAQEGDPVGSAGSQLSGWAEFHAMNASGLVAFRSAIAGFLSDEDETGAAIFLAGPGAGALTKIAQPNDIVGGRPVCGHSAIVGLNDAGQVLYDGYAFRFPFWQANHVYAASSTVNPTAPNGLIFVGTAGTSGATEPVWPTNIGATVADGTVTWTATSPNQAPGTFNCDESRHGMIRFTGGIGQQLLMAVGTDVGGGVTVLGFGNDVVPAQPTPCPNASCPYNDIDGYLNSAGHASVTVRLSSGGGNDTAAYLLLGPGSFTQVAKTGGAGPGGAFGRIYPRTEVNDLDQVLFKAQVGGVDKLIRFTPPSTYSVVASVGDDIGLRSGGAASGTTITALGFYGDINAPGNSVFQATLSVGPKAYFFWDGTTGLLSEIAREGGTFAAGFAGEMVSLSDNNVAAFTTGAGAQESAEQAAELDEKGLFLWTKIGGAQKAIAVGDVVSAGTVSSVNSQHPSFRRRQLSAAGCVATQFYVGGISGGPTEDQAEGRGTPYSQGVPPAGQLFVTCGGIIATPTPTPTGVAPTATPTRTPTQVVTQPGVVVPTLNVWGLVFLGLLLAATALMLIRVRQ